MPSTYDWACKSLTIYSEIRFEIFRYLVAPTADHTIRPQQWDEDDEDPGPRPDLAILGTNSEIYAEAAWVLYSELKIIVWPGDVQSLTANKANELVFRDAYCQIWRHDPLLGTGHSHKNGSRFYYTQPMGGFMEPHIFARFKKVELSVVIDGAWRGPVRYNENGQIDPDDETFLKDMLEFSTVGETFAKILSNSLHLQKLSILLHTRSQLVGFDYNSIANEGEKRKRMIEAIATGNIKTVELFIQAGTLQSLMNLRNVQNFDFVYTGPCNNKKYGDHYELLETAQDMKSRIQKSWRSKQSHEPTAALRRSQRHIVEEPSTTSTPPYSPNPWPKALAYPTSAFQAKLPGDNLTLYFFSIFSDFFLV